MSINSQATPDARGFLFIGDPHLASRAPGFRKDDYPQTILGKLSWCFDYARSEHLIPILLGDIFHFPRDNANWLLVEFFHLCRTQAYPIFAVVGNHDCYENSLSSNDSLAVAQSSGVLQLLSPLQPTLFSINQSQILLGGSAWNEPIPDLLPDEFRKGCSTSPQPQLVFWITHHDIAFSGYEQHARQAPREIPGIDVIINGHIHSTLPEIQIGQTHWLNPGNITRISRTTRNRIRVPTVLHMGIDAGKWSTKRVAIPCRPFEEIFFEPPQAEAQIGNAQSLFVTGLAQLEAFKSATGAGLEHFLDENLEPFEDIVQAEIRTLANEVLSGDNSR